MLGPNTSLLREKLGTLSSLSIVCYCARSGVYGKPVSQLFLPISMWVLSCSPNVQESSEEILLERIFLCVAVDSVCLWEEVCSEEIGEHVFFGNASLPKMISRSPFVSLPHI